MHSLVYWPLSSSNLGESPPQENPGFLQHIDFQAPSMMLFWEEALLGNLFPLQQLLCAGTAPIWKKKALSIQTEIWLPTNYESRSEKCSEKIVSVIPRVAPRIPRNSKSFSESCPFWLFKNFCFNFWVVPRFLNNSRKTLAKNASTSLSALQEELSDRHQWRHLLYKSGKQMF